VALYFFFSLTLRRQGGIIQHSAVDHDPGRFDSVWLRSAGRHVVAIVLLLGLAIPVALTGLLFLLLLVLHPNFH
jgi:hypothetical protein